MMILRLAPSLLLLPLAACGPSEKPTKVTALEGQDAGDTATDPGTSGRRPSGGRRGRDVPAAPSLGTAPHASESMGVIHGEIRFEGKPPTRIPLGARKRPECCEFPEVEHLSDVAIVNDGKVQYAYVYVRSGLPDDIPPPPKEPFTLDQRGCMYLPHVSGIRVGQELLVANSDPTAHNVNYNAKRNSKRGNRTMGKGQAPLSFVFERRELKVPFKCDIHPWMLAFVHVQDHPWFAVTAEDGTFRLPELPPGTYVVEAMHEKFDSVAGTVEVTAGTAHGIHFTLRP